MIIAIRISGIVDKTKKINETLFRMRLRRKYSAVLLKETQENLKLLQEVRNFVAFGQINEETLKLLIEKRAKLIGGKKGKIDASKIIGQLDKNKLSDIGIKPYFRLHPPIGGIKSKIHYPKGILGDNKEDINKLVRRML